VRATRDDRPDGRFRLSRRRLVQDILAGHPGGDVLDAGCGPGVMTRALLMSSPASFRITVLDQSLVMTRYCAANAGGFGQVGPTVGELEALPFCDGRFDVVLVLGALEYVNARAAVREISRVLRSGGLVIVTMLNPMSPYRIMEWFVYWPSLRILAVIERLLRRPAERRHGAPRTGIRGIPAASLRRMLAKADLAPIDLVHFDVTPLLPPFDRLPALARRAGRAPDERTVTRGWRRWMGTGYLVVARRGAAGVPVVLAGAPVAPGRSAGVPGAAGDPLVRPEGSVPGVVSRRAKYWRRIGFALAIIVAVLSAATARLFIWPAQGMPGRVSAIVMMDGPGRMLGRTLRLARQHRPRFLIISLGRPESSYGCPRPITGIRLICFNPRPASTAGEAEYVGRLARRYHWRSVALVTITSQDTRARLRVERCFGGRVYVMTTPPDPSQTNWPYQIVYQWGALLKALILQPSC
jgi:ubiquinone/menaquinone biosynthesis C-methylase UbiE